MSYKPGVTLASRKHLRQYTNPKLVTRRGAEQAIKRPVQSVKKLT